MATRIGLNPDDVAPKTAEPVKKESAETGEATKKTKKSTKK